MLKISQPANNVHFCRPGRSSVFQFASVAFVLFKPLNHYMLNLFSRIWFTRETDSSCFSAPVEFCFEYMAHACCIHCACVLGQTLLLCWAIRTPSHKQSFPNLEVGATFFSAVFPIHICYWPTLGTVLTIFDVRVNFDTKTWLGG